MSTPNGTEHNQKDYDLKLINFEASGVKFKNYLLPVPTRYVLVPWSVIGLGLHPRMRKTRGDSCSTVGKRTRFPAKPEYMAAILLPILDVMGETAGRSRLQLACCHAASCWSVHRDDSLDGQHKHGKHRTRERQTKFSFSRRARQYGSNKWVWIIFPLKCKFDEVWPGFSSQQLLHGELTFWPNRSQFRLDLLKIGKRFSRSSL